MSEIEPISIRQDLEERNVIFGKHEGKKIKDLPASYILWVTKNCATNAYNKYVKHYGNRYHDELVERAKEEKK